MGRQTGYKNYCTMNKLKVGGLFSGVGGIELAFRNTGYEVSWSNDMDKYAHITYQSIIGSDHYIGSKAMLIEDMLKLPNKNLNVFLIFL